MLIDTLFKLSYFIAISESLRLTFKQMIVGEESYPCFVEMQKHFFFSITASLLKTVLFLTLVYLRQEKCHSPTFMNGTLPVCVMCVWLKTFLCEALKNKNKNVCFSHKACAGVFYCNCTGTKRLRLNQSKKKFFHIVFEIVL